MRQRGGNNRSGQAMLLGLLALLVVALACTLLVLTLSSDLQRGQLREERTRARRLAEMGLDYAVSRVNRGDWLERHRPIMFRSKRIRELGEFEVSVADVQGRPVLRVASVGIEDSGRRSELSAYVTNPADLWRCIRNVYNYDYERGRFDTDATVEFGGSGVGVNGIVEELVTIPSSAKATLAAVSDSTFAGLMPGSDTVVDGQGIPYRNVARNPGRPGEYAVDYARAIMSFSPEDVGKKVLVFYDYFRRVPRPPGPYRVVLPYRPARDGSEVVAGVDGRAFFRDNVLPQLQDHYFLDAKAAFVSFSEHNTADPLIIKYHFLGCRMTGNVHVNGHVRWAGRNLVYLLTSRGDSIVATGGYSYAPGTKVSVITDSGRSVDPLLSASGYYRQGGKSLAPIALPLGHYRNLADPERGGDGLYFDNREDLQDLDAVTEEWRRGTGVWWSGGLYEPPGERLDIGTMEWPRNNVVYAEGNLRVSGRLPEDSHLTIVSGGTIYIEGNIEKSDHRSTVALLADQHVCLNATRMRAAGGTGRIAAYVAAMIYARRGSFAVIPGKGGGNELVILGAVNENRAYPNEEWARAFGAIEWVYDAALRDHSRRPPHLAARLHWGDTLEPPAPVAGRL